MVLLAEVQSFVWVVETVCNRASAKQFSKILCFFCSSRGFGKATQNSSKSMDLFVGKPSSAVSFLLSGSCSLSLLGGRGENTKIRYSSKCRVQCFSLGDRGGGGLITCSKYSWLILVQLLGLDLIFLSFILIMHIKCSPFQNCTKLPAFNILFSSAYSLCLQWTVEIIICHLKNLSVYEIVWIWFSCYYLYLCKIPKLKIQWSTD